MAVKDGLPSTDFSRMNREWVKAVAEGSGGGGGGIPEIEESDEGKVLTVDNGEAVWDSLPESPITYVTINWVEDTGTMSMTWQEIYNAFSDGKIVCVLDVNEYGAACNFVVSCIDNSGTYLVNVADTGAIPNEVYTYTTNSANGYPSIED